MRVPGTPHELTISTIVYITNWSIPRITILWLQGFTELVRERFKIIFHGDKNGKLTVAQEACAGIIGGE